MKSNDEEINERTRELSKRMENIAKEVLLGFFREEILSLSNLDLKIAILVSGVG